MKARFAPVLCTPECLYRPRSIVEDAVFVDRLTQVGPRERFRGWVRAVRKSPTLRSRTRYGATDSSLAKTYRSPSSMHRTQGAATWTWHVALHVLAAHHEYRLCVIHRPILPILVDMVNPAPRILGYGSDAWDSLTGIELDCLKLVEPDTLCGGKSFFKKPATSSALAAFKAERGRAVQL